jgi:hypothetical protein
MQNQSFVQGVQGGVQGAVQGQNPVRMPLVQGVQGLTRTYAGKTITHAVRHTSNAFTPTYVPRTPCTPCTPRIFSGFTAHLTLHTTLHKSFTTLHNHKIPSTHHISQRMGKEKKGKTLLQSSLAKKINTTASHSATTGETRHHEALRASKP